jgi:nucleotide-binding universal stress UspA family protein
MHPFEQIIQLADQLGAKINLLFVNTPEEFQESWEVEAKMESFVALAGDRLDTAETINTRFFEQGVQRYCEQKDDGILSIATHNSRGLSKLFLGGLAEKVVNHINIPVISVPIKEHSGYPRM